MHSAGWYLDFGILFPPLFEHEIPNWVYSKVELYPGVRFCSESCPQKLRALKEPFFLCKAEDGEGGVFAKVLAGFFIAVFVIPVPITCAWLISTNKP